MMKIQNHKNSNIKIKVACLFFAFFMWVYVMSDLDPVDTRDISLVTVTIANINELDSNNLTLSPNQELKVRVQIKGRRTVVAKKIKSGIKLQATIQNPQLGSNLAKINILGDNSDLIYNINPSSLSINLEEKITVEKKLSIKSTGTLAKDYYIDTMKLSKNSVYISGASSLIEKIDKAEVEVDLSNNSENFSKLSNIKILDSNSNEIPNLTLDNNSIVISVSLKKEKTVPIKADIEYDSSNFNISKFNIEPQNIKIQGLSSDIDKISEIKTKKISISELLSNNSIDVELNVPNNIYSNIKQVKLTGKIEKVVEEKNYSFDYSSDEIEVLNLEDTNYSIYSTENIVFSFSSKEEVDKKDIKLFIDVQNISNDTVNISYTTDKYIEGVIINPDNIKLIEEKKQ